MELRECRLLGNMTQAEAAAACGVSLRTYKTYETSPAKMQTEKYKYLLYRLREICLLDETHGVLSLDVLRDKCAAIFSKYAVEYAILFGSYAKNTASGESDVDLLVGGNVTGLRFYGLVEELRQELHKKIDLLDVRQLEKNPELLNEILKSGVRIYG